MDRTIDITPGAVVQSVRIPRAEVRAVSSGIAELRCTDGMLRYVNLDDLTVVEVPAVEHKTRTFDLGAERKVIGWNGGVSWVSEPDASWSCTCGASGRADTREQARLVARNHREGTGR